MQVVAVGQQVSRRCHLGVSVTSFREADISPFYRDGCSGQVVVAVPEEISQVCRWQVPQETCK